ncbi:hypothetical protein EMCRGX_G034271 [Ephydatia muelleri]
MAESRQGCWIAVSRCFWGPPNSGKPLHTISDTDNIEFEDLVSADEKAKTDPVQMVTDTEKERIQTGKMNELLEEQRKLDEAKDAELRRQEELLRQEEEAYYAAKRAAAQKAKLAMAAKQPQPEPEVQRAPAITNRTSVPVIQEQPVSETSSATTTKASPQPPPPPPELSTPRKLSLPRVPSETSTASKSPLQQPSSDVPITSSVSPQKEAVVPISSSHKTEIEEEEDFDQFLESVKITQQGSSTASAKDHSSQMPTDSTFEVDFGYWETATELSEGPVPAGYSQVTHS